MTESSRRYNPTTMGHISDRQRELVRQALVSYIESERKKAQRALVRKRNAWRPSEAAIHMAAVSSAMDRAAYILCLGCETCGTLTDNHTRQECYK